MLSDIETALPLLQQHLKLEVMQRFACIIDGQTCPGCGFFDCNPFRVEGQVENLGLLGRQSNAEARLPHGVIGSTHKTPI
jgi:hypothetical protein